MRQLKHILLAEDDERDVELTLMALEKHKLVNHVDVVNDGEEALNYLYRRGPYADRPAFNPVVVLLDLKMPKIGGLEVLRQMRADEQLKMVPVVIVTSSREEQDLIESYRHQVNAFVVKPLDFDQLVSAIRTLGLFWAVINQTTDAEKAEL